MRLRDFSYLKFKLKLLRTSFGARILHQLLKLKYYTLKCCPLNNVFKSENSPINSHQGLNFSRNLYLTWIRTRKLIFFYRLISQTENYCSAFQFLLSLYYIMNSESCNDYLLGMCDISFLCSFGREQWIITTYCEFSFEKELTVRQIR